MQRYLSSDISALAETFAATLCILDINKIHKSERTTHQIPHILVTQTINKYTNNIQINTQTSPRPQMSKKPSSFNIGLSKKTSDC